ncbi:MAG: GTPase ObgE [Nitriliruptoraceae bacterium]|nr:GTPase ObgE [Nitriliruptoraceae bacterium]
MDAASFIDECTVHVRGGDGGNGSASFRREAHVPRGGPDGGDGGRGGDVVLLADEHTTSLLDLRRAPHRRGGDGGHGAGMGKTGADGRDEVIRVPVGTVVRERDTGAFVADLVRHEQRVVVADGGRGGRGNLAFATRHRRLPSFAERGERTEERPLRLELKLIADVGLVGYPSAGKSSLVGRLSAATPRVEAWPFTTLTPHLGVMRAGDRADGTPIDVILADVPGLIEGAAEGKGLGIQFLRHIERCLVLLHVVDAAPMDPDRDPVADLSVLREELRKHDPSLLQRPQLVVLNKMDLPDGQAMAELSRASIRAQGLDVLEVSAITGEGLDALRYRLGAMVDAERERGGEVRSVAPDDDEEVVLTIAPRGPDFHVEAREDAFHVVGRRIQRWVQMLPLEDHGAVRYLQGRLRRAGVEKALVKAGARAGDEVVIGGLAFEFDPELQDLPPDERAAVLAAEAEAELDEPLLDDADVLDAPVVPPDDAGVDGAETRP